jgi:hypothetical protein
MYPRPVRNVATVGKEKAPHSAGISLNDTLTGPAGAAIITSVTRLLHVGHFITEIRSKV